MKPFCSLHTGSGCLISSSYAVSFLSFQPHTVHEGGRLTIIPLLMSHQSLCQWQRSQPGQSRTSSSPTLLQLQLLIGSRGAQQRNIPPGSTRLFDKAQKAKHNIYNINQFNSILKKRRSEQFWNIKYIQYQLHRLQSCQSTCVLVLTYDVIHMCTHHISEVTLVLLSGGSEI